MNERGYTLIELLAVIVVLALLSTVAFVSISRVMGTAKERYYISLENNLEAVARDFASDNRNYLPKSIGGIKKIYLGTLKKANYIKDVIDYNKSDCFDDQTYVQVFKYAKGKYSYTTFLVCPTYSTSKDSNSIVYPIISELYFNNDINPSDFSFKIDGGSVKLLSYTVKIYLDNRLDSSNTYMLDSKDSYSSKFSLSKYRGNIDNLRVELTVVNINGLATTKTIGNV